MEKQQYTKTIDAQLGDRLKLLEEKCNYNYQSIVVLQRATMVENRVIRTNPKNKLRTCSVLMLLACLVFVIIFLIAIACKKINL